MGLFYKAPEPTETNTPNGRNINPLLSYGYSYKASYARPG